MLERMRRVRDAREPEFSQAPAAFVVDAHLA
jgi:hypothetical protein